MKYCSNTDQIRIKYSSNSDQIRTTHLIMIKYSSNNGQISRRAVRKYARFATLFDNVVLVGEWLAPPPLFCFSSIFCFFACSLFPIFYLSLFFFTRQKFNPNEDYHAKKQF